MPETRSRHSRTGKECRKQDPGILGRGELAGNKVSASSDEATILEGGFHHACRHQTCPKAGPGASDELGDRESRISPISMRPELRESGVKLFPRSWTSRSLPEAASDGFEGAPQRL